MSVGGVEQAEAVVGGQPVEQVPQGCAIAVRGEAPGSGGEDAQGDVVFEGFDLPLGPRLAADKVGQEPVDRRADRTSVRGHHLPRVDASLGAGGGEVGKGHQPEGGVAR